MLVRYLEDVANVAQGDVVDQTRGAAEYLIQQGVAVAVAPEPAPKPEPAPESKRGPGRPRRA